MGLGARGGRARGEPRGPVAAAVRWLDAGGEGAAAPDFAADEGAFLRQQDPRFASDLCRVAALYVHGGIYQD